MTESEEIVDKETKTVDNNIIVSDDNGWDSDNERVLDYWMDYLSYCCLIYHFYLFKLKKIENYWAWLIIVFSALSSTISLIQYNNDIHELELTINILITIFTLCTTLISSWMKKQNYVEHISELSKYSLKINKLKGDVKAIQLQSYKNRMHQEEFKNKYESEIVECTSVRPLISPNDWKETIYIISKYFPELAAYEYPWKKIPNYGENAIKTYENLKYNGFWNKITHCFFCSWCLDINSTNISNDASNIITNDKLFYNNLSNNDVDYIPPFSSDSVTVI